MYVFVSSLSRPATQLARRAKWPSSDYSLVCERSALAWGVREVKNTTLASNDFTSSPFSASPDANCLFIGLVKLKQVATALVGANEDVSMLTTTSSPASDRFIVLSEPCVCACVRPLTERASERAVLHLLPLIAGASAHCCQRECASAPKNNA